MRILAVDDEVPVLEELVYLLRADPRVAAAEGVTDATAALRHLHRALDSGRPIDAVFLDLRMPGLNGMDMARLLAQFARPPAIVFVTAYNDSAVEAFELKVVDYLLKPVRPERLTEAVHRVAHASGESALVPEPPPVEAPSPPSPVVPADDETIPVELAGVTRFLRLSEVRFVIAEGDYARLHTAKGSFLVRSPLTSLEERWRQAGFVRIHRSHLVALHHVEQLHMHGGQLTVRVDGENLAVSRRHARQLRDLLIRQAKIGLPRDGAQ
ncbi:response regulator transcription factor [Solihabitans fulvus]|uniref:Response regulator transcription factor n=1 Tax=Solihabitans fulvus TaxID=1892852 RepID=A0A5B2XFH6_9PSEU|nr:response regulator transcription factor [Solihabitans fulvus]